MRRQARIIGLLLALLVVAAGCEVLNDRRVLCADALGRRRDAFQQQNPAYDRIAQRDVDRYCFTWVGRP